MSKMYKLITGIILAVAFTVSSAYAGGFSIGIIGNNSEFSTSGTETEGTGNAETTSTSIAKDVQFPSLFVEYSAVLEGGGFSWTVGIEHIPGSETIGTKSRTDSNTISTDDGTYTASAEVSDHTAIYFEPGYMFSDNIGIYGKVGATRVTLNSLESIAIGDDSSAYGEEDIYGGMLGFGVKVVTPFNLFVKLEATKTEYTGVRLVSTTGNKNIVDADTEQEAVRLAIGFNF